MMKMKEEERMRGRHYSRQFV